MNYAQFQKILVDLNLTGKLNRNTPESNRQAIRELLALNTYWTFDARNVAAYKATYEEVAAMMAVALGMSDEQFASNEPPYINPERTVNGLIELRTRLDEHAKASKKILFATAHPGSLQAFYLNLATEYQARGGKVVRLELPVEAPDRRWLDDVNGVIALSDEGNLMHSHNDNGFEVFVRDQKPDLVISDHGFAMGAINAEVPTVAIFDVDDPALPFMQLKYPDRVLAIPMNDNQTNTRSGHAASALWKVEL